ncbi:hypothetical protein ACFX2A_012585 [Malus domestica]
MKRYAPDNTIRRYRGIITYQTTHSCTSARHTNTSTSSASTAISSTAGIFTSAAFTVISASGSHRGDDSENNHNFH